MLAHVILAFALTTAAYLEISHIATWSILGGGAALLWWKRRRNTFLAGS